MTVRKGINVSSREIYINEFMGGGGGNQQNKGHGPKYMFCLMKIKLQGLNNHK